MGVVNWNGSYTTRALAFFTGTKCSSASVVMLARLLDDPPYAVQYIDLSGPDVPYNIRSFRAISLNRADNYGSEIISQVKKMRPGTLYVPHTPSDPTKSSYCYGSIVIPPWENRFYDLSSGEAQSWAEYKRAIVDLHSLFHDLRKNPDGISRIIGLDATEVPWEPGQEDLITKSDLHSVIVRPKIPLCELLPASEGLPGPDQVDTLTTKKAVHRIPEFSFEGEPVEEYQPPVEKRLKTQAFVQPATDRFGFGDRGDVDQFLDLQIQQTEPQVLKQVELEELQHIVDLYSGGSRRAPENRRLRRLEREMEASPEAREKQGRRAKPRRIAQALTKQPEVFLPPKIKEPWADFSVLTNPMLGEYLQEAAKDTLFDIASHRIVENARLGLGLQLPPSYSLQTSDYIEPNDFLVQPNGDEPGFDDFWSAMQEMDKFAPSDPLVINQPLSIEPALIEDPLVAENIIKQAESIEQALPVSADPIILEQFVPDNDEFDADGFLALMSAMTETQEGDGQVGEQPATELGQGSVQEAAQGEQGIVFPVEANLLADETLEFVDFPFWLKNDFTEGQVEEDDEFTRYIIDSWAREDANENPGGDVP
ncbi:hypothetical protein ABW21_db0203566 [Orbilia brochopaga]|nr:hypothetical protein ABW21_db0203566 [Drechslerella brochopaga]